jgi:hypothetical protein
MGSSLASLTVTNPVISYLYPMLSAPNSFANSSCSSKLFMASLPSDPEDQSDPRNPPAFPDAWGAIHQLFNIILQLRILVLLLVSTLLYVVKVKNYSKIGE